MTMPDTPELPPTDQLARFNIGPSNVDGVEYVHTPDGEWVRYTDVAAILASRATRLAAAPQRWKLVPVDLNDAMLNAGREAMHKRSAAIVLKVWHAMLDAAPAASSPSAAKPLTDDEAQRIHSMPYIRDCLLRYASRPTDEEANAVVRSIVNAVSGLMVGAVPAASSPEAADERAELQRIHEVVMHVGGDWPDDERDPYTLRHVKWMAREINKRTQA